jgi:hypothetical protein
MSDSKAMELSLVNAVCERFDGAWEGGERPRIEDYLAGIPEEKRPCLLHHLLQIELERRLGLGEKPNLEEYQIRFPGQTGVVANIFRNIASVLDTPGESDNGRDTGVRAPAPLPPQDPYQTQPGLPREELAAPASTGSSPSDSGGWPEVPGYEILGELGRGGIGVVYKVRQLGLQRLVALKMILADAQAGPHELTRFRREAEAVAYLHHPNIVQIYEVGEQGGLPYFSLEFVAGGSLARSWPARRCWRARPPS